MAALDSAPVATVGISALGSRGDVQPIVALAGALQRHGHAVRIVTHARFAGMVERAGVVHVPAGEGFESEALWTGTEGRRLAATRDPLVYGLRMFRRVAPYLERHFAELAEACRDVDVVLGLHTVEMASTAVARALRKPYAPLFLSPPDPRFYHPPVVRDVAPRVAGVVARWLGQPRAFEAARARVLGPIAPPLVPLGGGTTLVGVSEHVVPRPADWDPWVHTTGYWLDRGDEPLAPDLAQFLERGPPPVVIGFGSMPAEDPVALGAAVVEAVRRAECRAVVLGGYGSLASVDAGRDLFWAPEAPHATLFRRASAVVHHGGAGTTAAAFAAGVPQLAVPWFGDQPFWARRIARLGVGPSAFPRRKVRDAAAFGRALRRLARDPGFAEKARALGAAMASEKGEIVAARVLDDAIVRA